MSLVNTAWLFLVLECEKYDGDYISTVTLAKTILIG